MSDGHVQIREVGPQDLRLVLHHRRGMFLEMASLFLHASAEGRPLYEELGFEPTNEMRLRL